MCLSLARWSPAGVEEWYHNTEHVKKIVPTVAGEFDSATQRFPFQMPASFDFGYVLATLTRYQGEDFEFLVTAKDDDDCAELVMRTAGLPASRDSVVEGVVVDGMQAQLFGAEFIADYPEFPQ
eukprot:1182238-Prorocentrum_minimum.AAC.1